MKKISVFDNQMCPLPRRRGAKFRRLDQNFPPDPTALIKKSSSLPYEDAICSLPIRRNTIVVHQELRHLGKRIRERL